MNLTILIEKLVQLLNQMCQEHAALIGVSETHRKALVQSNLEILEEVVAEADKYAERVSQLERDRQMVMGQLADELDIAPEEITVTSLSTVCESRLHKKLSEVSNRLARLVNQLSELNLVNQHLTEQSLKYTNWMIKTVSENPQQIGYGPSRKNMSVSRWVNEQA